MHGRGKHEKEIQRSAKNSKKKEMTENKICEEGANDKER